MNRALRACLKSMAPAQQDAVVRRLEQEMRSTRSIIKAFNIALAVREIRGMRDSGHA